MNATNTLFLAKPHSCQSDHVAYIYTNIITIDKYVHTNICTYIYVNRLTMTVECKFRMASLHRKKLIISEYLVILCYTLSSVVLTDQIVEESKKNP